MQHNFEKKISLLYNYYIITVSSSISFAYGHAVYQKSVRIAT